MMAIPEKFFWIVSETHNRAFVKISAGRTKTMIDTSLRLW